MEKYGEKPKPFSPAWWENTWYYYKGRIIGGIFVLAIIIFGLTQCLSQRQVDFPFTYIGVFDHMGSTGAFELETRFGQATLDANGDGKRNSRNTILYIDPRESSKNLGEAYNLADMELTGGASVVYFMDESFLERNADFGYVDLSEWAKMYGINEELLKRDESGKTYAINMKDNAIMSGIADIKADGMYMVVRPLRKDERTDIQKKLYENGINMAQYIISGGVYVPQ